MRTRDRDDQISDVDTDSRLPDQLVADYRETGFVRVRGALDQDELDRFREAAEAFLGTHRSDSRRRDGVFTQLVNVWKQDETIRDLTLQPRLGQVAEQLAGIPLRIWHDQMLVKEPYNEAATEFHQDRPYWPHSSNRHSLTAWIALVDVPPDRGCMAFIPGTHEIVELPRQDLTNEEDLFALEPSLRWLPRVTIPLRAGDCTFHNGYTGHMALPNRTDRARLAHCNIYFDADTRYNGNPHPVTDSLGLNAGDPLDGDQFPRSW